MSGCAVSAHNVSNTTRMTHKFFLSLALDKSREVSRESRSFRGGQKVFILPTACTLASRGINTHLQQ